MIIADSITTADLHWTADKIWVVTGALSVEEHTLTIDAGTVVCFGPNAGAGLGVGAVHPGTIQVIGACM